MSKSPIDVSMWLVASFMICVSPISLFSSMAPKTHFRIGAGVHFVAPDYVTLEIAARWCTVITEINWVGFSQGVVLQYVDGSHSRLHNHYYTSWIGSIWPLTVLLLLLFLW
jgi:hypothetical protein